MLVAAEARPQPALPDRWPTEPALSSDHCSSSSSSSSSSVSSATISQQSSVDWQQVQPLSPAAAAAREAAKQINWRLMHTTSPWELFDLVNKHSRALDSINVTAALQRLAKLLSNEDRQSSSGGRGGPCAREAALSSPVFHFLAGMMTEQCHGGAFNSQSTANAWWAVAKLYSDRPAPAQLLAALEAALLSCLGGGEADRPNAQAVSSVWYSWGRLATTGDAYEPSLPVLHLLWERTRSLSQAGTFDSQGIANMLWAFGQQRRRHADAFAVCTQVLARLTCSVAQSAHTFSVQGLSCSAVGCANLGPALHAATAPLVRLLVAESLRRHTHFSMQAMANMASALSRMNPVLTAAPATRALLAAFDAHAASLPPSHRPQDVLVLSTAMRDSQFAPIFFRPPKASALGASAPLPPPPAQHHSLQEQQQQQGLEPAPHASLRDTTNCVSSSTASCSGSAGGHPRGWRATHCRPLSQLAVMPWAMVSGTGFPLHLPPHPQQAHRQQQCQSQYHSPPPPAATVLQLVLGAEAAPLTFSQNSQLAQQVSAAGQLPFVFLPAHLPPGALPYGQPTGQCASYGLQRQGQAQPMQQDIAASNAAAAAAAHQAHLLSILATLQQLKLQHAAAQELA